MKTKSLLLRLSAIVRDEEQRGDDDDDGDGDDDQDQAVRPFLVLRSHD